MAKMYSARMIGNKTGESPQQVNRRLEKHGLIKKSNSGEWELTELGKQFGEKFDGNNGVGGTYARKWTTIKWNEDFTNEIIAAYKTERGSTGEA
ncbi:hypothetical protein QYI97_01845 [Lacticaseibacillus paracasei]|uniref:hypothetical protein n=1 Tax=Lacticaseibacillus paracasei TaxID=1597 RepID=UPI00262F029E|nr:hypothetical protein [Lacticaseibacillus paracasei]MDN4552981.1 hypothetical protein [Lacticaseibacillus paracasei]